MEIPRNLNHSGNNPLKVVLSVIDPPTLPSQEPKCESFVRHCTTPPSCHMGQGVSGGWEGSWHCSAGAVGHLVFLQSSTTALSHVHLEAPVTVTQHTCLLIVQEHVKPSQSWHCATSFTSNERRQVLVSRFAHKTPDEPQSNESSSTNSARKERKGECVWRSVWDAEKSKITRFSFIHKAPNHKSGLKAHASVHMGKPDRLAEAFYSTEGDDPLHFTVRLMRSCGAESKLF